MRSLGRPSSLLVLLACVAGLLYPAGRAQGQPSPVDETAEPTLDLDDLVHRLETKANAVRAAYGRPRLAPHPRLRAVAAAHSADMAAQRYFDHLNPDGLAPAERVRRGGEACAVGENLFVTLRYAGYERVHRGAETSVRLLWKDHADLVAAAFEAWLASPGHRATLLNPAYRRHGIGIALADDQRVYVTHNLCP